MSTMRKPQLEELEARFVLSSDSLDILPVDVTTTSQLALVQQSMGTYVQVAGAIPPATSSEWFTWYNTLKNARLDYSMQPRAQTFYFSSTGNDATGNGSQASPWQSLSKARSVLTQTGGNVALLFKRGDEFYDSVGLTVNQTFVTIGAWGDTNLPKPMLSAFTNKYAANTNLWTQVPGTNSWTTSAPNRIGWIRDATNDVARLSALTYVQTASAAAATSRSWTWNNGTLYLNPGIGVNPNTINWEAVGDVAQDGILMSGDGGLITDIRADGWGAVAGTQYQNWGIKVATANNWSVVVMNTESYYNGRHGTSTHSYMPDSSGGFALLINNISGYTNATAAQTTVFNMFSPKGGNEVLSEGNTVRFGKLPDFNLIGGGLDTQTPAFFGHTGGQAGQTISLVISMNDRVIKENYAGSTFVSGANTFDTKALPGDNADLLSLRHFIVNYQVQTGQPYTISAPIKTVQMNSLYQLSGSPPLSALLDSNGGWFINCIWAVSDPISLGRYFFNAYSATPTLYMLYNSFFLDGNTTQSSQTWDILVNFANQNQSVYAANNVFARTNTRNINLNVINDAQHLLANAYYQVNNTSSYSGDPFGITLTSMPNLLAAPTAGSKLIGGAKATTFGYTVDYDFYGHLRNMLAPTLGAIDFDWASLPITDAGQYYIVQAGQSLALEARNVQAGASYSWEINGDAVYGDAVGANPTLTWSQLLALGMNDGSYSVRLRTTIGSTVTYSNPAYLEVINRAPYANAGAAHTVFGGENLSLDASGSFAFTPNESLTYTWDINGDGVFGDATGINPTVSANQLINLGLVGGATYGVRVKVSQSFDPTMFSISTPATLTYFSLFVDPGGPYLGIEGQPITLTAGDAGPGVVYQWDFNNDGIYNDATGQSVNYTAPDNGVYTVGLQIAIGSQLAYKMTTVTAVNAPPTVTIVGNTTVTRKAEPFTVVVHDAATDLASGTFTLEFDWNGDGIYEESIVGPAQITVNHTFDNPGGYTFYVRATDKDGGVGPATPFHVTLTSPYAIAGNTLNWYLTDGDDSVTFTSLSATTFRVNETQINGSPVSNIYQFTTPITRVSIFGQKGNDYISTTAINTVLVTISGGLGNDTILGSTGNDQIDGGEGQDTITDTVGNNKIDGAEGNDTITAGVGNDTINGDDGDDFIDAGDGNDYVDGGEGGDQIFGGAGDDVLIGDKGSDSLSGEEGDDLLFGGVIGNATALAGIWTTWKTHPIDRHTSIVAIDETVRPTTPSQDTVSDFFDPGSGFDVTYDGEARSVTMSQEFTGSGWIVTTSAALANAIANAQPGDLIYLAGGTYDYTAQPRALPGVTITGIGPTKTIIRGSFIIDNQGDQRPTVIKNLTLDQTGLANVIYYQGNAYNIFSRGTFYVDTVEVKGPGISAATAVYFYGSASQPTRGYITNSYFHDTSDDILSTWGGGPNTGSIVEIYDSTLATSGPSISNQVITANNGLSVAVIGGSIADSAANVVASDSLTPIDIFFATISAGTRNSGIYIPATNSIIHDSVIYTNTMTIYGTVEGTLIIANKPNYPVFVYVMEGATADNNYIVNNTLPVAPGLNAVPLRVIGNNATVVDNIFQYWHGLELDIMAGVTGTTLSGNTYQE